MKNLSGKKAILYRRVSTTDQKDYGNSLNNQKNRLYEFCNNHNISAINDFEEDYSAKNFVRPTFNKLLEYATKNKNNIDFLFVQKWDRFSRELSEALNMIKVFKSLNIEINSTEQWIDHSNPNHKMMLYLYLGIPEVDNLIRSERTIEGMRSNLKEGRWVYMQPKGYMSGKDIYGKVLMKPNPKIAPLITDLFNVFSSGNYSQNELLNLSKYKPLKLTRSNISRLLKQIAYAGKIIIPEYKDESETIVDALHKPLISLEIYNQVQILLDKKSRFKNKPSKQNEYLPLRGHLRCHKCGSNLTGSGSKSKTGAKHYYYHCNPRKGCNERFKVKSAHSALTEYLKDLKPNEEVCNLLELILKEKFENSEISKNNLLKNKKLEITNLKKGKDILLKKLMKDTIDDDTYKEAIKKINTDLEKHNIEIDQLKNQDKNAVEFIRFGIYLFKNLNSFFEKAIVSTKQKLLSSILSEKLVFEGSKYRTPELNKGFKFIYQNINKLTLLKQKNGKPSFDNLPLCTRGGT